MIKGHVFLERRQATGATGWRFLFTVQGRLWLLIAVIAGAATFLYWVSVRSYVEPAGMRIPWWVLAVAFYLAERHLVDLEFRQDAHSFSLSEIPLVLGLFFSSPHGLLLAQLTGLGAALMHRRLPWQKLLFNLSTAALGIGIGITIVRLFTPPHGSFGPWSWSAAYISTAAISVVEVILITSAIRLSEGGLPRGARTKSLLFGLIVTATNTSIALLAATTILRSDYRAALLLVFPSAALFLCYRAYSWQRQRSQRIESLYESTRVLHRKLESASIAQELLANARSMFRAETAEVFLLASSEGDPHLQAALGPGEEFRLSDPEGEPPGPAPWVSAASKGEAILLARPIRAEPWKRYFTARGIREAMIVPLFRKDEVIGGLLVGNRQGNRDTYGVDDLQLFKTLANHASVSLENARLVERLRTEIAEKGYLAMHDALTGLPNRALFRESLGQALLAAARDKTKVAVILMDLDRFKDVNDTLGHPNGDILLKEIAGRLTGALRQSDTAARLSGDEFAILLRNMPDFAASSRASQKILESLSEPFVLEGVTLDVRASLGIAIYPDHGSDPDTLIQRADVAMYLAKGAYSGYEVYAVERDEYSRTRLALVGELRKAIEQRELDVHYQPKVHLRTGRVTGVEALARWTHPVRGAIPPDAFIPLAESAGLIRDLTLRVLDTALAQCRIWQEEGLDIDVSVNLSARDLELQLPDEVARLLAKHELSPDKLVLEMTESMIMEHPLRALEVVDNLNVLGVALAIDDFGTGYSSLAYLTRLPAREIKVDKTFVMGMGEQNNAVIVRSTVDLGCNLGLRVVAEGVETEEVWTALRKLGCEAAQGYYVGKPCSGYELSLLLRDRQPDPQVGGRSA